MTAADRTKHRAEFQPPEADELRAAVRRFIGARVAEPAHADDLTQDVLVKVQQRLSQVRDPRRLMGWVIQIARNTVADFFRSAKTTEVFREEHVADSSTRPGSFDREESQLREDLNRYIRSVVQELPPKYRDALTFTEYDGLSQVELAERLGLTVSAAKSRVQRGRAMVRAIIDQCCHFEVDRYGTVVDCTPKPERCDCHDEPSQRK
ncbi:MAG TPA: sigma-70 family RNA polymerase sigma factor [Opitutus sp.]|nr:sigma-70 family RNA polymerase sigma factor [Opitutus sp.]